MESICGFSNGAAGAGAGLGKEKCAHDMDANTVYTVDSAKVARKHNGKEIHYSNFFVTFNTNIRPKTPVEARFLGHVLYVTLQRLFQEDMMQDAIKTKPGTEVLSAHIGPWAVELGPEQQRVHGHAVMKFVHDGWLQLDPKALQKTFISLWPTNVGGAAVPTLNNVYVNVKWGAATSEMIARYLAKQ